MSSQDPLDDKGKRSMRRAMHSGFQRAKDAFKRPSSPHPPSGSSGRLNPLSFGSRLQSSLGRSSSGLVTGPPSAELNQLAITPPPEPPVHSSTLDPGVHTAQEPEKEENAAWVRLTSSLRALESGVDLFPPLKSAVGAFIGCLDLIHTAALNRADYEEITLEFQSMADMMNEYASELDSESTNGSIANIARSIETQVASITQHRKSGTMGRLVNVTQDQEDVIRRYRQVERLSRQLQTDTTMRTKSDVKKHLEASTFSAD